MNWNLYDRIVNDCYGVAFYLVVVGLIAFGVLWCATSLRERFGRTFRG